MIPVPTKTEQAGSSSPGEFGRRVVPATRGTPNPADVQPFVVVTGEHVWVSAIKRPRLSGEHNDVARYMLYAES